MNPLSEPRPKDLLIVTRRFWPYSGLTEIALAELAQNFQAFGHRVTIASLRWAKDWCEEFDFCGIRVVRFGRPVAGPWSSFRYSRALGRHLKLNDYDAVIVSGLGDEALAATRTVNEETPVVLHIDEGFDGVFGSIHRKHIETCLAADAAVANSPAVASFLRGYSEMPELSVVPMGIRRSENSIGPKVGRGEIRECLTKTHPVLRVERDQLLVVACSRMNHECGLTQVVEAWPQVLRQTPGAKLWLIGEGRSTGKVWESIIKLDLAHSVILPGNFDNLDEIFAAADLYVHADGPSQTGDGLLRAMASGIPAVCVRNRWTSQFIEHGRNGLLVDPSLSNADLWAKAVADAWSDEHWRSEAGRLAASTIGPQCLPQTQVNQYLALLAKFSGRLLESAQ